MKVVLGIGCDRGTSLTTIEQAVNQALAEAGVEPSAVHTVASIDLKADETGLQALARQNGWPLVFHPARALTRVPVPNPSEVVRHHVGTPAVAEAAALFTAGVGMENLLVEKLKRRGSDGRNVTVSVARMANHEQG
uniref:Cobalt-precorrin 5A hydrolase n=1 Tax=Candidatus Kentrum sp. TUN TaxID=2126343 RepID=A0A450ZJX0_9GAMM|nr:MAG: cobalt-precorrin 5A hydrolase [Candidatus Kentron sp. TUN]VFK54113.1 MAG: cobalt-precorrin 5A hydrolase [Candidatus Kentron sp. TUN]VFK55294.1 MAG: cobalt-precorrin 5A hydrolase [Candidatus Kentron sp. TUN]